MSLKKRIGKLIPYSLIAAGRRVVHAGPQICEVCGAGTRDRIDFGYGFPVLERLQVVGGLKRRRDYCPVCHSGSRERLIWLYFTRRHPPFAGARLRVAHFAPEKGLSAQLLRRFPASYNAYDISPERYRHLDSVIHQNLEGLTLADNSVDLLLCNHVMEHVYDLPAALAEIRRVLSPEGLAIMQVPIALKLAETRSWTGGESPEERVELFGQDDHVRLFSATGYREALESAGLAVELYEAFEDDAETAAAWELDPFETLYLIRKG